jgi:hypothetical protein
MDCDHPVAGRPSMAANNDTLNKSRSFLTMTSRADLAVEASKPSKGRAGAYLFARVSPGGDAGRLVPGRG